ncbi:Essential protein Yae1, N terminal [Didymosphaeria variabile]|uniref:Protein YAE1 n=1 Tax=Didymosphaeria variabile TaxID=1932322 RepID=A0A9W8XT10_9PLEO|nr:Essential protein Yae1, N terminal [Didymosphaeria variabile]KAJ4357273.1 Essential protein Yae1, N terminal [Didymosphaeria variabile]
MIRAPSPDAGIAFLPAGNAPPTPPHADPLDDIYGSSPAASPTLAAQRDDEILSDLPSRQRNLDTDAYREGLSAAKGKYVQEGFDEGFSLGAEIGLLVGRVLGVLQGMTTALKGHDEVKWKEANILLERARSELAIESVLGREWVDEEGIWKWEVEGLKGEEEVTFQEVARHHPVVKMWLVTVGEVAKRWSVDLEAVEKGREDGTGAEQS